MHDGAEVVYSHKMVTLFNESREGYAESLAKRLEYDLEQSYKIRERSTIAIAYIGGIGLLWLDGLKAIWPFQLFTLFKTTTLIAGLLLIIVACFICTITLLLARILWPIKFKLLPTPYAIEQFRIADDLAIAEIDPSLSSEHRQLKTLEAFISGLEQDVEVNSDYHNFLLNAYSNLVRSVVYSLPFVISAAVDWKLIS